MGRTAVTCTAFGFQLSRVAPVAISMSIKLTVRSSDGTAMLTSAKLSWFIPAEDGNCRVGFSQAQLLVKFLGLNDDVTECLRAFIFLFPVPAPARERDVEADARTEVLNPCCLQRSCGTFHQNRTVTGTQQHFPYRQKEDQILLQLGKLLYFLAPAKHRRHKVLDCRGWNNHLQDKPRNRHVDLQMSPTQQRKCSFTLAAPPALSLQTPRCAAFSHTIKMPQICRKT